MLRMEEQGGPPPLPMIPEPEVPVVRPSGPAPFASITLVIMMLVWLVVSWYRPSPQNDEERIAQLYYPAETTLWYTGAQMFAYEGVKLMGPFSRAVVMIDKDDIPEEPERIGGMLEETIAVLEKKDAASAKVGQLRANLVIVLAEGGEWARAQRELVRLKTDGRYEKFIRLCRAVYEGRSEEARKAKEDFDFGQLGESWMRWRFEAKVAGLTGDAERADWLSGWMRDVARQRMAVMVGVGFINWLMLFASLGIGGVYLAQRIWTAGPEQAPVFPATCREGVGIFLAASLAGLALFWSVGKIPVFTWTIWFNHSLISGFPVLLLFWWRSGRYDREAVLRFLGVKDGPEGLLKLLLMGMIAFPIAWL
ncbi:MAG: hypothetical protein K0Q55_3392, partial [Verrucomicrobia bacterium]|nr:hypothetical protein [Verrucomicrobiota bacterium]